MPLTCAHTSYDALVIGSGPNGLAAAIRIAQQHRSVLVLESNPTWGGGARSGELTLPGLIHDLASAVHPLAAASPFFRRLPLARYGLQWIHPPLPLAHPLPNGEAAALYPSLQDTVRALGKDGPSYKQLLAPLLEHWEELLEELLQPMAHWPRHPVLLGRFGRRAIASAGTVAQRQFQTPAARALWAGLAAHSFLPLEQSPSGSFGLVLALAAHAVGWPIPRGGAQRIADALVGCLRDLGGEIQLGCRVDCLFDLPPAKIIFLDLTPRQILKLEGFAAPAGYRRRLERYRYGPGVFKLDYALSRPIPWQAALCHQAGTVHVGGTFEEIAASERAVHQGREPEQPFVILSQPSLWDPSRAPAGRHTAWAYCHVPRGSTRDMTESIERQIERFAPGFQNCILARHTSSCRQLEAQNANLVGGDISGGANDWRTLLARPRLSRPYQIPPHRLYVCSAASPPGGGVHGMGGFHAAETALSREKL